MKNNLIRSVMFLITIFLPIIIWVGLKFFSPMTYGKLKFDTGEKRELANLSSDDNYWTEGTAMFNYIADRAPFRSSILVLYRNCDQRIEWIYQSKIKTALTDAFFKTESTGARKDVSNSSYDELFGKESNEDEVPEDEEPIEDPESEETAEEHNFEPIEIVEPTCAQAGHVVYECTICGDQYSEVLDKIPHNLIMTNDVTASFDNYGHKDFYCIECGYVESRDWVDKFIDDSFMAPSTMGEVILGRSNWLFYAGLGTLDYYKGNNIMSDEEMQAYTDKLIAFNDLCAQNGIKLGIIIAPAKEQVYSEYMPTYTIENEYKRDERLADYIREHSEVAFSYPLTELQYAGRYWQDYSKYDTHWNRMGAYIGIMSVYKGIGNETISPNTLAIRCVPPINAGDLFALGGIDGSVFEYDGDFAVPYKEDINITFRSSEDYMNAPIYYATSDCGNNQKAIMIGDSYRSLMIPYLERDYSVTVVCHKDSLSEFEPYFVDVDTLILVAAERNDMDIISDIDMITEWLKKE